MFTVLTVAAVIGVMLWLFYQKFLAETKGIKEMSTEHRMKSFFSYLPGRTVSVLKPSRWERFSELAKKWAAQYYPGWWSWVFYGLLLSFIVLVFTGFGFALFVRRGLFGLPLLLHMVGGGVFAVCLSLVVIWRGRDYRSNLSRKETTTSFVLRVLFWVFVGSGLCLIITALGSMLSFFAMNTQSGMIDFHRYSGLVSLLSAIIFVHFSHDGKE
jgi:hypothetical protein